MAAFPVPNPFKWDASFDVKSDYFNDQHKKLFDLINDLDAHRDDGAKLKALLDFAVKHFKDEEDSFEKHHYADAANHKATHDKFVADASKVAKVDDGAMGFIRNWLVNHIKGSDMGYAGKI